MDMKPKLFLLFAFVFTTAAAQWSQDPKVNTVWEQPENQGAPVICTDGDGGAIVAWGSDNGIRANRVDKFGYRQWGNNGMPVLPVPGPRYQPILFLMAEEERLSFGKILPKVFNPVIKTIPKTKCMHNALTEPEQGCGTRAAWSFGHLSRRPELAIFKL
jgi:hypothetical protein